MMVCWTQEQAAFTTRAHQYTVNSSNFSILFYKLLNKYSLYVGFWFFKVSQH